MGRCRRCGSHELRVIKEISNHGWVVCGFARSRNFAHLLQLRDFALLVQRHADSVKIFAHLPLTSLRFTYRTWAASRRAVDVPYQKADSQPPHNISALGSRDCNEVSSVKPFRSSFAVPCSPVRSRRCGPVRSRAVPCGPVRSGAVRCGRVR